jgi:hypothetical protein
LFFGKTNIGERDDSWDKVNTEDAVTDTKINTPTLRFTKVGSPQDGGPFKLERGC